MNCLTETYRSSVLTSKMSVVDGYLILILGKFWQHNSRPCLTIVVRWRERFSSAYVWNDDHRFVLITGKWSGGSAHPEIWHLHRKEPTHIKVSVRTPRGKIGLREKLRKLHINNCSFSEQLPCCVAPVDWQWNKIRCPLPWDFHLHATTLADRMAHEIFFFNEIKYHICLRNYYFKSCNKLT